VKSELFLAKLAKGTDFLLETIPCETNVFFPLGLRHKRATPKDRIPDVAQTR
jgi:hypothetical protein